MVLRREAALARGAAKGVWFGGCVSRFDDVAGAIGEIRAAERQLVWLHRLCSDLERAAVALPQRAVALSDAVAALETEITEAEEKRSTAADVIHRAAKTKRTKR